MVNRFFSTILNATQAMNGKRARLLKVLARLVVKMRSTNLQGFSARDKLQVIIRMFRAYVSGRYTLVPWKSMAIVVAGIIYFINPIDLVPDFIPLGGLVDDASVLLWVFTTVKNEIDKFLDWEMRMHGGGKSQSLPV